MPSHTLLKDCIRIGLFIYVFSLVYFLAMWFSIDPNIHWGVVKIVSVFFFFFMLVVVTFAGLSLRKFGFQQAQMLSKEQLKYVYKFNIFLGAYIIMMNLFVTKTYSSHLNFFLVQLLFVAILISWSVYKLRKC